MKFRSNILKLALFATGLSGIVAEYILSTLATYFLGNSVFQWTMIVSIMLFSMGLGSGLSKLFKTNLLQKFIYIEFILSIMVSFSSLLTYTTAAYTSYTGFIIYLMSIIIGILIGMEIPLVVRLNDEFEELRVNVASVIEKDYYGSLAGGVFFAFVGLPYLGLTYTPFVLGAINFMVALCLFFMLWSSMKVELRYKLSSFATVVLLLIGAGTIFAKPVIVWGEQQKYADKVIYHEQSKYQRIVLTQWKDNYWLFINRAEQFSTLDEMMYHEPLVHPVMKLTPNPKDILIMGGGDGCAVRELLKYPDVRSIRLVDLDPAMTDLGKNHPILKKINENAMNNPKVQILNQDGYNFLESDTNFYDVVIIDLPDPKTVELGRLYSYEFYRLCYRRMRPHACIITQAGSAYYSMKAFKCNQKTMAAADFQVVPLHNQILTLGEWGWVLGVKESHKVNLKKRLRSLRFDDIETRWINNEAMQLITSFGKDIYINPNDSIEINTIHNPVLYQYYLRGNWEELY